MLFFNEGTLREELTKLSQVHKKIPQEKSGFIKSGVTAVLYPFTHYPTTTASRLHEIVWKDRRRLSNSYEALHKRILEATKTIEDLHFTKDLSQYDLYRTLFAGIQNTNSHGSCIDEIEKGLALYAERAKDPKKVDQLRQEFKGLMHTIGEVHKKVEEHFAEQAQRVQIHAVVRDMRELAQQLERTIPRHVLEDSRTTSEERAALYLAKKPEEMRQMSADELRSRYEDLKGMVTSNRYFFTDSQRAPFTKLLHTLEQNLHLLENPSELISKITEAEPTDMPVEQAKALLSEELPKLINRAFEHKRRFIGGAILDSKLPRADALYLRKNAETDFAIIPDSALKGYAEKSVELIKKGFGDKDLPKDVASMIKRVEKRLATIAGTAKEAVEKVATPKEVSKPAVGKIPTVAAATATKVETKAGESKPKETTVKVEKSV